MDFLRKVFAFILKGLTPVADLLHVPADKLAHVVIGALCVTFGWATGSVLAGFILALIVAFVKEWVIDATPDWEDFWTTIIASTLIAVLLGALL